ncbi:hypothetical protein DFH08DRAFT_818410 [Mycena albidolilacea]|uniref:Uncharacterized protein n=1 Tax=Mycena albidolilacea TaxID=1033008 RepID=A0AAD6ZGE6_9AGAR|nr:hypothetical protein DFH08DRAFT_818410 [Mycena albidolilacea]
MSTFNLPRLSQSDEAAMRKLHKTIRATRYEDPLDQDAFLVASATSVLEFRAQVASFALIPEVGECVFAIRALLLANNPRLGQSTNEVLSAVQDFAGEIARLRKLFRDRKNAQAERLCAAEGVAARAERRLALEYSAKLEKPEPALDEDVVSIPLAMKGPTLTPPPSPMGNNITNLPSDVEVRSAAPLSPLAELDSLMVTLTLSSPSFFPPIPTGPRAGLRPNAERSTRKRRRPDEEEGPNSSELPRSRPRRACFSEFDTERRISRGRAPPSKPSQHILPPTEIFLRRRLAGIQAEIHRLSCTHKHLTWQLQSLVPSEPSGTQAKAQGQSS